MKLIAIFLLGLNFQSYCQAIETSKEIIEFCSNDPRFPGGNDALQEYIIKHLQFSAITDFSEKSKIYVSFLVKTNGEIADIKIDRGINQEIDQKVIEAILNMPRWDPADINGSIYATYVRIPITICVY